MAKTMAKTTPSPRITSPRSQRDAADQLAAAIALSQQEACVLPQQHPSRPKRERRAATPLTYPADQTHASKTEMARDKKNVERYFDRMQRKLAAEEDVQLEVEPTPAEEPKAKKQARPSKRTEVEPTPAAPEEPKAKKQARPSKRTSEVQKIAEAPAEAPEPVLFAEVVCSEVMTISQKVSGRGDGTLRSLYDPQFCPPQVKRIQRELEIDASLSMIDAVHAAETMLHWDFTQLDAAPLRVRIERLPPGL